MTQGLAWIEYARLERVGTNAALYHSLQQEQNGLSGQGQVTTTALSESVEGIQGRVHAEDNERQAKRPRLSS